MTINVRDLGAMGDGVSLDGPAIQAALDRIREAGGGTVTVPAGKYMTGTLRLYSHTHLHLEMGAVIRGVDDPDAFPILRQTPYGNLPGHIRALLACEDAEDVVISGEGTFDGGGEVAPSWAEAAKLTFRPGMAFFRDVKRARFEGVRFLNTRFWNLHLMRCNDATIRGVTIWSNPAMPNSDGIDPDGCQRMIISDCNIRTCDDAIVVKSTEGDECRDITVTNCIVSSRCAALKLGTEAIGDIRNVLFNNCVVYNSNVALALYQKDGSIYENVIFSNVVVESDSPIAVLLDVTPRYHKDPKKGTIRQVTFENVVIKGKGRCLIEGLADRPIEDVTIRNMVWRVDGKCDPAKESKPNGARRVELDPLRVNHCVQPAHFMVVHAKRVHFDGVRVAPNTPGEELDRRFLFSHDVESLQIAESGLEEPPKHPK